MDEANGKRLLPFPPVTGETHLHHPKPRRPVGNIDDSLTDSGSSGENGHETTSGTEGYETALETPSESENIATINGGREEPTIQELVASEPTSKPVSGVEAWELDLGETVKRIGRDTDDREFKRGGSIAEIGRKAGKHTTAPRGGRGVTDGPKRGHILGMFDPPKEERKASDKTESADVVLEERKELHVREQWLSDKEEIVTERERAVSHREQAVTQKEQAIRQREKAVQRLELEVERREGAVGVQEQGLIDRQALEVEQWSAKQREMREQAAQVEDRQRLLHAQHKTLADQESNIATREARIRGREVELRMWEKRIEAKEEELDEKIHAAAALAESGSPSLANILRTCWRMLGVDAATPGPRRQTDPRNIRRDILFGPSRSGGYLVLMSIGVCVVALRVFNKIRRR
jgi:hypothetical protein